MLKSGFMAVLCIATGLGCATVQAQEVYDWNGFYAGVFGGYDAGALEYDISQPAGTVFAYGNSDINGLFGGAEMGFNYQFENGFVLGAEADVAASSTEVTVPALYVATGASAGVAVEGTLSPMASIRARAGFAIDRFLPFVTGGVALTQTNFDYLNLGPTGLAHLPGLDQVQVGWTLGAGLEYAFTENISAKAEYRYTQFGGSEKASSIVGSTERASFQTHDARVGVNYHF